MCVCVHEHVYESSLFREIYRAWDAYTQKAVSRNLHKIIKHTSKKALNTFNFTLVPFGIAVSSTSRQRILHATKRTEMDCNRERAVRSQFQILLLTVHITCVFQNGKVQYIQALRDKLQA